MMDRWSAESDVGDESSSPSEVAEPLRASSSTVSLDGAPRRSSPVFHNEPYAEKTLRNLAALRRDGRLCDVVLIVGSRAEEGSESEDYSQCKICAHRSVLAAACPYFSAMFTGSMLESKLESIYLKDFDLDSLKAIIDYIYSGKVSICERNVQSLLTTASLLQMSCVRDACSRFLLDRLDPTNCLGITQFASMHGCSQLAHAAKNYTQQHFNQLTQCDEFLTLEKDRLIELISSDRLTITGEENVFEAVMNWVRFDEPTRSALLPELMEHVRLPLLSQDFLIETVDEEPLMRQSAECKDFLLDAYRFHLKRESRSDCERYRPRQPVPLSKRIMLIGGQAPKAIVDVDVFDLDALRWSRLSDLPQRRCRCGVGEVEGRIYAVGGFNGSLRVRTVDAYDRLRDRWTPAPPMDARRSTLGVATLDHLLIAVGGFDGTIGLASAEAFDSRQGKWMALPSMTVRRSSVGVASLGGVVYAVGGYDGATRQCLNTVECFDLRANRWRSGPNLMQRRSGAGVAVFDNHLVAVGGHDGPIVRDTSEYLCDDVWTPLPLMNVCRRNASVCAIDSILYAFGGDDGASNMNSIESLNVSGMNDLSIKWTQLEVSLNQARSYTGLALLPKT